MIKNFLCLAGLIFGLQTAWGFALLGPNPGVLAGSGDAWQVVALGYDLGYVNSGLPGGQVWLGDIGGPMNYGEGYRRNVPVLYYVYDSTFWQWFGTNGEAAADQAFAIMNNTFTNNPLTGQYLTNGVDDLSSDLSEFPFQSQSFNYTAQNLYLTDLKSVTLHLLVEQMGLTEPERYTWTLHDRYLVPGGTCPMGEFYLVVQRNFDVTPSPLNQVQFTPYVNNVLYNYFIEEDCDKHPPDWSGITVPRSSDPLATIYTAVAANNYAGAWTEPILNPSNPLQLIFYNGGLQIGGFYTGLTRDDVGGLRYLLHTNSMNWEFPAANSILLGSTSIGGTNLGPLFLLSTSNYTALALAAITNVPVTLSNLFPGLVIANSSYYFTTITNPNLVAYYTNVIGQPAGTLKLVIATNGFTITPVINYVDTFGNVVIFTNGFSTNTSAQLVTISVAQKIGAPAGTITTNTTVKSVILTNVPSGEYYISTNPCGPDIIVSPQPPGYPISVVTATTNVILAASNSAGYPYSQSLVTYATNHIYIAQALICSASVAGGVTNGPGYYQGIGRVQFVRVPDLQLDPLTGTFASPITNIYKMVFFNPINSQLTVQTYMRVVTQPDILINAADLALGPNAVTFVGSVSRPPPVYVTGIPGTPGPGTIGGPTAFTYNKVGPVFYNGPFPDTNGFTDTVNELTQTPALQWASFDGTTNDPVLYPSGTSIQNLENQMVISILPTSLPDGTNNVAYPPTAFSATGGQPAYTWSLGAGTQLPLGLSFLGGVLAGTPSGNSPGIYDFTIQLTDSLNRVVALNYTITIH